MARLGAILISTGKSFQRRGPITEKARHLYAYVWNAELKEDSGHKILGFSKGYTDATIQIGSWVLDCAKQIRF